MKLNQKTSKKQQKKEEKITKKRLVQRDYVLHDPQLRHLLGTLQNYGHQLEKERQKRLKNRITKQSNKKNDKIPKETEEKETKKRPKTAITRDYVLHEPRFRDLQDCYLRFLKRPTTADQTKDEKNRKERLSEAIKEKKEEILEARKEIIEDLEEQLTELEEEEDEEMTNQEKLEHKKRVQNLKNRIDREKKNIKADFLPRKVMRLKPDKLETVLEWNNPPQYDRTAPQSRILMQVNKHHGPYMDATRKAILDNHVQQVLASERAYAEWKRQIRQNVAEKLRNEGVQPVKLRQKKSKMTATMPPLPAIKARVYEKTPEHDLQAPGFRYLANTEANYVHLFQDEARKQFCKRFVKAQEIELRKQEKREKRIEMAATKVLQRKTPAEFPTHRPCQWKNISRDYVKHEPLFRYIENVKLNFYDYLTPRQRKRIDKKYQEMRKRQQLREKELVERRERYCEEFPKKCTKVVEELKPEPELAWTPRAGYVLHEPLFRYYEEFREKYLCYMDKKQQEAFLVKYKEAEAKENERRKKKQSKDNPKDENPPSEDLPPVTPRTDYDLFAPCYRFVQNTAENYEPYLGEKSKDLFLQRYEMMKQSEKERLEKLARRQKAADDKNQEESPPQEPSNEYTKVPERNYDLADPRYCHLHNTWQSYRDKIPDERKEYVESLLRKLSTQAENTRKILEKRREHANAVRYPETTKEQLSEEKETYAETPDERMERINRLATPNTRLLETTYALYKDVMDKEKAKRIKETIDREKLMSMEEMENQINKERIKMNKRRNRIKYRKEERPKFQQKLQKEAYKKLIVKILHKLSRELPKKILYSPQQQNFSENQTKIYFTAVNNFKATRGLSHNNSHLHGLTMQIVQFFDQLLN